MAIGRKIKAIKEEKEGKFSLTRIIDRQISAPRPKFSFKTILYLSKKLVEAVKDKDFEQLNMVFNSLWRAIHADSNRESKVFHPSELMDACPRKLYYDISGTRQTNPDAQIISPKLQRIFDQGSWIHTYIQAVLVEAGIALGIEVPVVNKKLMIEGRADVVINIPGIGEVVVEIKSINDYGYSRLKTRAKTDHVYQASIYAVELKVSYLLFLYWNKNNCELKEFLEPVNKAAHADAVKVITEIQEAVKIEKLPERACIEKHCERSLTCVYHSVCWSK